MFHILIDPTREFGSGLLRDGDGKPIEFASEADAKAWLSQSSFDKAKIVPVSRVDPTKAEGAAQERIGTAHDAPKEYEVTMPIIEGARAGILESPGVPGVGTDAVQRLKNESEPRTTRPRSTR